MPEAKKRGSSADKRAGGAQNPASAAENPASGAEKHGGAAQKPPGDGAGRPAARTATRAQADFADELRAWRERLGYTQVTLADAIGYSGSFVSDVERRARVPGSDFADACDRVLKLPGTFARIHQRINEESFPGWFAPVIPFETRATRIHNWDMRCLPGLLQTADYARAVIRAGRPDDADDIIERDVEARMQRQEIFDRGHSPSAWFIVDESALRRVFGSRVVMAAQLDKFLEQSKNPGLVIQVLPSAAVDCAGVAGPMTIFDIPDASPVAYTEGCKVGRIIEAPGEVAKLATMFDHLRAAALPRGESGRLIAKIRSEYGE